MTSPEWLGLLDSLAASTLVTVLAPLVLGGALLCWWQQRARRVLEARLERLEHTLTVYAEAATSVARTVDQVLLNRAPAGGQVHSSRRYLLQQARSRLADGEPLVTVASGLGLSRDEVQLLDLASAQILVGEPTATRSSATRRASAAA